MQQLRKGALPLPCFSKYGFSRPALLANSKRSSLTRYQPIASAPQKSEWVLPRITLADLYRGGIVQTCLAGVKASFNHK
jgi:hypothetical protein